MVWVFEELHEFLYYCRLVHFQDQLCQYILNSLININSLTKCSHLIWLRILAIFWNNMHLKRLLLLFVVLVNQLVLLVLNRNVICEIGHKRGVEIVFVNDFTCSLLEDQGLLKKGATSLSLWDYVATFIQIIFLYTLHKITIHLIIFFYLFNFFLFNFLYLIFNCWFYLILL